METIELLEKAEEGLPDPLSTPNTAQDAEKRPSLVREM